LIEGQLAQSVADARLGSFASLAVDLQGNPEYVDQVVDARQLPAPGRDALDALFEIFRELQATEASLDDVLGLIVEKAAGLLQTDLAWSTLVDHAKGFQSIVAAWGARSPDFKGTPMKLGAGIGGMALSRQRTLVVTDYASHQHTTEPHVRERIVGEGVVSLVAAPMIVHGVSVGMLYVGNRQRTAFGAEHCSLLSLLAAQASLAIWNGRLHREMELRHRTLERSFEIHRELTAAALRGAGIDGIVDRLTRLVGREVLVELSDDGRDPGAAVDDDLSCAPIIAGSRRLGTVSAAGGPLTELEQRALQHGAAAIALELLKERGARSVEQRLRSELLSDLLDAPHPLSDSLMLRTRRLGVDTAVRRVLLVACPCDEDFAGIDLTDSVAAAAAELVGSASAVLTCRRGGLSVAALPLAEGAKGQDLAHSLQRLLSGTGVRVTVGVGRPGTDLRAAFREARACAELGRRAIACAPIVDAEQLGPLRFLLDAPDLDHAADLVRRSLAPLVERRSGSAPLLDTLRAYLDARGHHPTVAAACSLHRSSLKYRLGRIQRFVGRPLSDPEVRLELGVAFRLLDVLEGLGLDPLERRAQPAA
jgi:sugar diacid utilization regulator